MLFTGDNKEYHLVNSSRENNVSGCFKWWFVKHREKQIPQRNEQGELHERLYVQNSKELEANVSKTEQKEQKPPPLRVLRAKC